MKAKNIVVTILLSTVIAGAAVGISDLVAGKPEVWRWPDCGQRQIKPELFNCPTKDHTITNYGWPYRTRSVTRFEDGRVSLRKGLMANNAPFPFDLWYSAFLNWVIFTLSFTVVGLTIIKYRPWQIHTKK